MTFVADVLHRLPGAMSDFTELFGEEIVVLVFSFLPVADLHRAARVNHTWMRIALDQQCVLLNEPWLPSIVLIRRRFG
jgi:hypothetical protein